jgi:hypothetical protein
MMINFPKTRAVLFLFAMPTLALLAQGPAARDVEALVRNLGSSNFKLRQEAFVALKERPDALPALETALKSPDRELAKRAAEVISFIRRKPVRDLESALNNGELERFVDLMLAWSDGKYENEAWPPVCEFANKLRKLHEMSGGDKLGLSTERTVHYLEGRDAPLRIREKRVTELASSQENSEKKKRAAYICADEVDLDYRRLKKTGVSYHWLYEQYTCAVIAKRSVYIYLGDRQQVIFCAGGVELAGGDAAVLIVSAGDVVLDAKNIFNSLVIAKGGIIVKHHRIERTRLIAGKKVIIGDGAKNLDKSVLVSENDPNPLGFIRWSDPPKDKATPKSK